MLERHTQEELQQKTKLYRRFLGEIDRVCIVYVPLQSPILSDVLAMIIYQL